MANRTVEKKKTILIVDDEPGIVKVLEIGLEREGYNPRAAFSGQEALQELAAHPADLVLLDLRLGRGINGFQTMQKIHESYADLPIVMMTAYGSIETAVKAIKSGACDFVCKPFTMEELWQIIKHALAGSVHSSLSGSGGEGRDGDGVTRHFGSLIGEGAAMQKVYRLIERSAPTDATVLIEGESGTGKELVAQALHARSKRCKQSLVPMNCAAVPENLLESEMFGHTAGAFTGAVFERQGLFLTADGGTLFLDEIGVMDLGLQRKLLRALQEGRVRRVGENQDREVNVRVIAATNECVEEKVRQGKFREDLYYRINVIPIQLPPLRERGDDVLRLTEAFRVQQSGNLEQEIQFADEAISALRNYDWPGNVRELQNAVACAATLCEGGLIRFNDLPPAIVEGRSGKRPGEESGGAVREQDEGSAADVSLHEFLKQKEQEYIQMVLQKTGGNRVRAADILGISRATFYRKYENSYRG